MSWINGQLFSNDYYREHVKDLENKKTMLLEQRKLVNEELAHLDSENIKTETKKQDMLAQARGRLQYLSFMRETAKEDLGLVNRRQKEEILSEQSKIFNFNMVQYGPRTENLESGKAKFEMTLLECRCMEMETRDENMRTHIAQLEEENKGLRMQVGDKVTLTGTNNLATQEWAHFGYQHFNLDANKQDLTGQIRAITDQDEHIKALKDQIANQKTQAKNPVESEDTLCRQNASFKNALAELQIQSMKMKKLETENSDLRSQLQWHQDTKKTLIQSGGLVTESLQGDDGTNSVKKEGEKEALRAQVKALQENKNCLNDEIRSMKDGLARAQSQSANIETQNCELKGQVKALKESTSQLQDRVKSLNDQVALLQSQRAKMETQTGDLRAQVKGFQENEDILIKQNEALKDEVSQLEICNVRTDKQNENLRSRVKTLKENENSLSEKIETLMADVSHFKFQRENDQTEIHRLRRELQTLRSQLQDQEELLRRIDVAESLMEKEWAEKEKLSVKLGELWDESNFVKKQNDAVRVELEKNKCVQEHQCEQIAQLRATLQEYKLQLEEAQFLLYSKDDELAKQNRKIVYLNEVTEELNSHVSSFKQQMHFLKGQLELRQMDEILTHNICGSLAEIASEHGPVSENQSGLKTEIKDVGMQIKDNCLPEPKRFLTHTLALRDSPSLKMETENEELRTQIKALEENELELTELIEHLNEKLAHLESWGANGDAGAQDQALCQNQDGLAEQNNLLNERLADLETENGDLRVQVEDLKENEKLIKQRTETLMAELDQYKTERSRLRSEAQTLRSQLHDQSDLRGRMDHAESQMEKDVAEKEKLSNKLRELEEKENCLKKQHDIVRAEMEAHKSVREQQNQQIAQLKAALKENELQVEEARFLLDSKDDELEKLNEVTKEMKTLILNLKQKNCHLQRLLELIQTANREDPANKSGAVEPVAVHLKSASSRLFAIFCWPFKGLLKVFNISSFRGLVIAVVFFCLGLLFSNVLSIDDDSSNISDVLHKC
ncbi:myosin heavy chain, non-muscle-like [Hippocampus zosterae]|uniref:myosin heavy chain, non-muscle-like n=1 Tax=Hippocampus zosterae TaxID=109293 RepID=UPI00223CCF62|nr:myosin heavy chain, non-muscle-like [Hippocampus zosterae]XP_051932769.1 myosin heavy chain, non-muscle-like [Hippocampus zosterae]XP_051932770.1 myosin heavy chain, non-muscle-like [Hippocampus zosterae]XP_051932771.1 myosin heavy chain, non-muscle-like [Hippocampus zosterae]XP_051932772.1 myosin heavy chain, non-muscle-like [Hippocampus zosterae]